MTSQNLSILFQSLTTLGSLVSGVIFFLVLWQLILLKRQIADTRKWNKMSSAFTIFNLSSELVSVEYKLNKSFIKFSDRKDPLSEEEMNRLFSEEGREVKLLLREYLNILETYCTAVNMGIVDSDVAKRLYEFKIV